MLTVARNAITEWSLTSGQAYRDPFNEVTLDVAITDPQGKESRIPAFWGGGANLESAVRVGPGRRAYLAQPVLG